MNKIKKFFIELGKRIRNMFLLLRFPFLKVRNCGISTTWRDFLPYGWNKAFGIKMFKEFKRILRKAHYVYKYKIFDIKEKWGELRIDDNGVPDKIGEEFYQCVEKYTELSMLYCIHCGEPTCYVTDGWINYICPSCKEHFRGEVTLLTWNHIGHTWENQELFKKYWAKPRHSFKPNSKGYIITGAGGDIGISKIKVIKKDNYSYEVMRKKEDGSQYSEFICEECVFKTQKEVYEELKRMLDMDQVAAIKTITDETK